MNDLTNISQQENFRVKYLNNYIEELVSSPNILSNVQGFLSNNGIPARNMIPYNAQTIPVVVLNDMKDLEIPNSYPQFYLTQLMPYLDDTCKSGNQGSCKEKSKWCTKSRNSDSSLDSPRQFLEDTNTYKPHIINKNQQKNKYLYSTEFNKTKDSCHIIDTDVTLINDFQVPFKQNIYPVTSTTIKRVGKFTVSTLKDYSQTCSIPGTNENMESTANSATFFCKNQSNRYFINGISENQQPRSRFKKTRIKETIERWFINGLSTFDCRFKVIPSEIIDMKGKNTFANFGKDKYVNKFSNPSRGCSDQYTNKKFKFWNNGDRISICGKPDYEQENYCKFHNSILKLLDQNQNLNLSKLLRYCLNAGKRRLSSSQIIRAVLISSPDNENYTLNIDSNQSGSLSAPPVSPSVLNSAHITSLPLNLRNVQSPQSMVMLRCPTPGLRSNNSRKTSFMNESISLERLNTHSSKIEVDSKGNAILRQPILLTDDSLMEMWQNNPINCNYEPFNVPSSTYLSNAVYNDVTQSSCSVGHIPHIFYSMQQQSIPSISTTIINENNSGSINIPNNINEALSPSSHLIKEIDNSTSSFKSVIRGLIKVEQQPFLNQLQDIIKINENLKNELSQVKERYEYLKNVLEENHIIVNMYANHDIMSMPDLSVFSDVHNFM